MPFRPEFWNVPSWAIASMYVALGASVLGMVAQVWARSRLWRVGQPESSFDRWPLRFARLIKYGLAQIKIANRGYGGVMHLSIFWAIVILFAGTVFAIIDADLSEILRGDIYLVYEFALDGVSLFLTLGLGLAMIRRWMRRPEELTYSRRFSGGLAILFWILLTGLLVEGLRLAAQRPEWAMWSPVGNLIAHAIRAVGFAESTLRSWHLALWIVHFGLVGVFLVTLPQATLFLHLVTSPLNILFSDPERQPGALVPIEDIDETDLLGVGELRAFTWKALLNADACTECGRCQVACPAYLAGHPLNPKQVILDIRDHLWREGPGLVAGKQVSGTALIGDVIQEETLWACTTCLACVYECPVLVEHVDAIVGMRRHLTLVEGKSYGDLQQALVQVERTGNPWGHPPSNRFAWAEDLPPGLHVPLMAHRRSVDVLYWVGCIGSFDPKGQKTTRAMIRILNAADIDFAVLGDEESCNCEWARRAGDEKLFGLLAERNLQILAQYSFKRILTHCPHCFNTFRNEYPHFGGDFQVVHHSQFIVELVRSGQLEFRESFDHPLTYHDSCHLGRYNGVYDAPRDALRATGVKVVEMKRSREKGLCCGGGGAHAWFELEDTGHRSEHKRPQTEFAQIPEIRLAEAMSLKVDAVAAACPFCALMLNAAAHSTGGSREVDIVDIAEIVAAAL